MSEELLDEVEAINSIYGDGSLVPAGETPELYILSLPEETVSLRLQFPPDYPALPPRVTGSETAGGRRGDGARDLQTFRTALGNIFQPGTVCLFDAIEEIKRLQEEAGLQQGSSPKEGEGEGKGAGAGAGADDDDEDDEDLGPAPPWAVSDAVVELKSVFVARAAAVAAAAQAARYVRHLLATDRRARAATHHITAWRIRGGAGAAAVQDCDDGGEAAAGGRLLRLMQLMGLWDAMVVVTRWHGGPKLGPRRFALINAAARDAFVKAGLVAAPAAGRKKGRGK